MTKPGDTSSKLSTKENLDTLSVNQRPGWSPINPITRSKLRLLLGAHRSVETDIFTEAQKNVTLFLASLVTVGKLFPKERGTPLRELVNRMDEASFEETIKELGANASLADCAPWKSRVLTESIFASSVAVEVARLRGHCPDITYAACQVYCLPLLFASWTYSDRFRAADMQSSEDLHGTLEAGLDKTFDELRDELIGSLVLPGAVTDALEGTSPLASIIRDAAHLARLVVSQRATVYSAPFTELSNASSWTAIHDYFVKVTEHYRKLEPRLFSAMSPILFRQIKIGATPPPQPESLQNRNPSLCELSERAQRSFDVLYRHLDKGMPLPVALDYACEHCCKAAGFLRGCIYSWSSVDDIMTPTLAIGPLSLRHYKSYDLGSQNPRIEALRLCQRTSRIISNRQARFLPFQGPFIMGPLQESGRDRILVLERDPMELRTPEISSVAFEAVRTLIRQLLPGI